MFLNKCQFRQSERRSLRFSVRNHFLLSLWLISYNESQRVISSDVSLWSTIHRINFSIDKKSMERVLTSQILKLEKQIIRENDQKIKVHKLNQSLTEKLEAAITQSERRYKSFTRRVNDRSLNLWHLLRTVVSHCSKFNLIDNVTKESIANCDQINLFHFYVEGKSISMLRNTILILTFSQFLSRGQKLTPNRLFIGKWNTCSCQIKIWFPGRRCYFKCRRTRCDYRW